MLGISTPDAIALGTLILAALAAWQGARVGANAARRPPPPDPAPAVGRAPDDHGPLRDLVEAVRALEATIGRVADEHGRREEAGFADALRRLEAALTRDAFD